MRFARPPGRKTLTAMRKAFAFSQLKLKALPVYPVDTELVLPMLLFELGNSILVRLENCTALLVRCCVWRFGRRVRARSCMGSAVRLASLMVPWRRRGWRRGRAAECLRAALSLGWSAALWRRLLECTLARLRASARIACHPRGFGREFVCKGDLLALASGRGAGHCWLFSWLRRILRGKRGRDRGI